MVMNKKEGPKEKRESKTKIKADKGKGHQKSNESKGKTTKTGGQSQSKTTKDTQKRPSRSPSKSDTKGQPKSSVKNDAGVKKASGDAKKTEKAGDRQRSTTRGKLYHVNNVQNN